MNYRLQATDYNGFSQYSLSIIAINVSAVLRIVRYESSKAPNSNQKLMVKLMMITLRISRYCTSGRDT